MRQLCSLRSCILLALLIVESGGSGLAHATEIKGTAGFRATAFGDATDRSQSVGLVADLGIRHALGQDWTTTVDLGARLETGTAQNYLSSEYRPARSIDLFEAAIRWQPDPSIGVHAGALNQRFHQNPLLFSATTAFPGVREVFEIGSFEISAEQAIPTALTTTSSPALGSDLPFFDSERVRFKTSGEWISLFEVHVGHYGFHGLPSSVAAESRLLGNDVGGIGPSSVFASRFDGIEGGASVTWHAGRGFKPTVGVAGLSNLAARAGRGRALLLFGELAIPTSAQVVLTPHLDLFRSEGDAAVGSYSSGGFGHGNRLGFSLGLRADLKKSGLSIGGSFTRAAVIASTPFQSDLTGFVLNLRKSYDLLP